VLPNHDTKNFTLAIDGRLLRMLTLDSIEAGLADKGRRVEIVDRATGDVVKRLPPTVSSFVQSTGDK
jgi:hypothetical protein